MYHKQKNLIMTTAVLNLTGKFVGTASTSLINLGPYFVSTGKSQTYIEIISEIQLLVLTLGNNKNDDIIFPRYIGKK